jgi:protein CpxP
MSYFDRNKWWALAFVLLVALNVATLATFWIVKEKNAPPRMAHGSGVTDFLVKELGLDSAQEQKLVLLREEHQQKIMETRKGNREAKDALFALLQQSGAADSVIEKAAKNAAAFDTQLDLLTFRHFQQVRNLCTEMQKKKFDEVIQEVLRMIAPPPPGRPQGPPPPRREGDGPPLPGDDHRPPPPQ